MRHATIALPLAICCLPWSDFFSLAHANAPRSFRRRSLQLRAKLRPLDEQDASRCENRTNTTPAPGPMPLRAAHAGQYEYAGGSTDSEGETWGARPAPRRPPHYEPHRVPRARTAHVDTPAHAGAWSPAHPSAAPAYVPDDAGGVGFAAIAARAALKAARARPAPPPSPRSHIPGSARGHAQLPDSNDESGKSRFVIEALLIPKQHATSDTCVTDEEEGVQGSTDKRGFSLITLGWSCFMSSVDLHTHASFQRMLTESLAVVRAPKPDSNLGICRLADPPGLQCTAKRRSICIPTTRTGARPDARCRAEIVDLPSRGVISCEGVMAILHLRITNSLYA
ncbi:hypothetical protein DFH09DRAFT_1305941 [Mycena vulgaris]|nr:hypothetical protein DFH09DRAFT_1305941 [Mycena vulgaris]